MIARRRTFAVFGAAFASGLLLSQPLLAQIDSAAAPPAVSANPLAAVPMFVVGASDVQGPETPIVPPSVAAGTQYQYNSLRVITDLAPRGCSVNNWTCMSNLCKADLGTNAWRGWAGCWSLNGKYICYFECSKMRAVQ